MPIKTSPPTSTSTVIAVDEGDDATSSSLSFTLDASGTLNATSYAWTCTAVPGAGDPAFPTGTTTGAQTIDSPSSVSTGVTVTGPGRYVFTVTPDGDASKAQTVSVLVSRPLPALQAATPTRVDGEAYDDAAGASSITLSETAGADSPTYSTTGEVASTGSALSITDSTSTTPSWTNPGGSTTGETVTLQHVVTDAYGRTDRITYSERIAGSGGGGGSDLTAPPTLIDPINVVNGTGSETGIAIGSWSDSVTVTYTVLDDNGAASAAAATSSGSGAGPYEVDVTGLDDNTAYLVRCRGTAADGQIADFSFSLTVGDPADTGAQWSTLKDLRFDDDITDLTITVGGGDTTLYESDGTTVKATVGAGTRISTPNTSTARITAADGGFYVRAQKSSANICTCYGYVKLTDSDFDFTDETKLFALDILITSVSITTNGDHLGAGIQDGAVTIKHAVQTIRNASTDYRARSVRQISGVADVGTSVDSQSAAYDYAIRIIMWKNQIVTAWSARQSTFLSGFPSAGGVVSQLEMGTNAVAVDSVGGIYGTPWYVALECVAGVVGAGDTEAIMTRMRVQEYA